MQKNKILKGLLAVSAVAAMFSTVGVQAQTTTGSNPSQTGTSSTNPNQAGKTTKEGTMDNSNSTGMENRANQMSKKGMSGSSGAAGSSGTSGASSSGMNATGGSASGQSASGATAGSSATGAKLSSGDAKAVKDMAMADMAEVATGKLAQSKAESAEVKAFGQQMIDDHGAALAKVQALAQARGVTLPTDLDAKHKAMSAKLEKMSGAAFDKAYMAQAGVKDHTDTHKKLLADAKKIKDPEVKALADQHMPVVEQHLKAAKQMPAPKSGTTAGK